MAGPDIKTKAQCDSESLMCRQILHVCRPRFVRSRLSVAARGEGGLHFHFPHMHYVAAAAPGRVRRHQPEWSSTSDTCFPQRIPFHQRWLTPRTVCPSGRLAWECCMVKLANGFPKFALFSRVSFFLSLCHTLWFIGRWFWNNSLIALWLFFSETISLETKDFCFVQYILPQRRY